MRTGSRMTCWFFESFLDGASLVGWARLSYSYRVCFIAGALRVSVDSRLVSVVFVPLTQTSLSPDGVHSAAAQRQFVWQCALALKKKYSSNDNREWKFISIIRLMAGISNARLFELEWCVDRKSPIAQDFVGMKDSHSIRGWVGGRRDLCFRRSM